MDKDLHSHFQPGHSLARYLAHAIRDKHTLSFVFHFEKDTPWADNPAEIVVVYRESDSQIDISPLSTSPPGSLAFSAESIYDVFSWLNFEHRAAFCLCPADCNANVIFVLRCSGKLLWIMLRVSTSQADFSALLPDNLFRDKASLLLLFF